MKLSKDEHYKKMTQTPVEKLTLSLALPAVVSILITMIYNMADTWFCLLYTSSQPEDI